MFYSQEYHHMTWPSAYLKWNTMKSRLMTNESTEIKDLGHFLYKSAQRGIHLHSSREGNHEALKSLNCSVFMLAHNKM